MRPRFSFSFLVFSVLALCLCVSVVQMPSSFALAPPPKKSEITDAVKGGKGLVVYHHASSAFTGNTPFEMEFEKVIAGGWRKQGYHGKMHEFTVTVRKAHSITAGLKEFKHGRDELYQNSVMLPKSEVLVTAYSDLKIDPKNTGKHEPVVWVARYGKGRVVNNVLGHDVEAMKGKGFQTLLIRERKDHIPIPEQDQRRGLDLPQVCRVVLRQLAVERGAQHRELRVEVVDEVDGDRLRRHRLDR